MRLTPENYQIIQGHEPAAADGILDTCTPIHLENADGVLIVVQHGGTGDADPILTIHQGSTAAECTAGTYPLTVESGTTSGSEFKIWKNVATDTSDTNVRQTDGVTVTIDGNATGGKQMVIFYVAASCLTSGRKWLSVGSSAGSAANFMSVLYILDGGRYQQTTPPTAIA